MNSKNKSIGIIGLGVMGANLALNIEEKGWPCVVYERESEALEKFIKKHSDKKFTPAPELSDLSAALEGSRVILMMIKAGAPVDSVIEILIPLLEPGDVLIDGGNSYYKDTERRLAKLAEHRINFIGMGVSGGEEGARHGPSLMPGGSKESWEHIQPVLEAIAAKHETPCVDYIGGGGAGHFVKMVHNGIEYGVMQLLAECYHLARSSSLTAELADKFDEWNKGRLESFLVEISRDVLRKKDPETGGLLVDCILDSAGQKGTGRWTAQEALGLGVAVPTITAAVDARILSSRKEERVELSSKFSVKRNTEKDGDFFKDLEQALYSSILLCFDQGMTMLKAASDEHGWSLNRAKVSSVWRAGCILRARLLGDLIRVYSDSPDLKSMLDDKVLGNLLVESLPSLRTLVSRCASIGVPVPAFSASLNYLESLTTANLPQNLIQGQRDNFGAHTYKRTDKEGVFHTEWGSD